MKIRNTLMLLLATGALAACDIEKSSRSGSNMVGEPQPRAVTLFSAYGNTAECTQNKLARVPEHYDARYLTSSKTFTTTLGRNSTCADVSVEDHLADTTSRYDYSNDYGQQTKHTYSYGGVYVGLEETQFRPHNKGPTVVRAFNVYNGVRQPLWALSKNRGADGWVEQFEYQTYGSDGRQQNRIQSGTASSRVNGQGQQVRTLALTVKRDSWAEDAAFFMVDKLLLKPDWLASGRYTLRAWHDAYGELETALLEGPQGVAVCYEALGRQVLALAPNRWGTCEGVNYDTPLATVDY